MNSRNPIISKLFSKERMEFVASSRKCTRCGKDYIISDFADYCRYPFSIANLCKECHEWHLKNKKPIVVYESFFGGN